MLTIASLAACVLVAQASVAKREVPDAIIHAAPQTTFPSSQAGIRLQSGSIAYMVPDSSQLEYANTIGDVVVKEGILEKIKAILPVAIKKATKALGTVAVAALTVVAVGAALTGVVLIAGYLLCAFTSFCYLPSVAITGFSDESLQEAARTYLTPDKLAVLSNFVTNSIEAFKKKYKISGPNKQT